MVWPRRRPPCTRISRVRFSQRLCCICARLRRKARPVQADYERVHGRPGVSPGAIVACCSSCVQRRAARTAARSSAASRCRAARPVCFALTCAPPRPLRCSCARCAQRLTIISGAFHAYSSSCRGRTASRRARPPPSGARARRACLLTPIRSSAAGASLGRCLCLYVM